MVCQNCKSTKYVEVKSQAFCLDCGRKISQSGPETARAKVYHQTVKTEAKPAHPAKKPKQPRFKLGPLVRLATRLTFNKHAHRTHATANFAIAAIVLLPLISWPFLAPYFDHFLSLPYGQGILAAWLALALFVVIVRAYIANAAVIGTGKALDDRPVTNHHRLRTSRKLLPRLITLKLLELISISAIAVVAAMAIKQSAGLPVLGFGIFGWVAILSAAVAGAIVCAVTAISAAAILTDRRKLRVSLAYALRLNRPYSHRALAAVVITLSALALPLAAIFIVFALARWNDLLSSLITSGGPFFLAFGITLVIVGLLMHFALLFSQFLWLLFYQKISRA